MMPTKAPRTKPRRWPQVTQAKVEKFTGIVLTHGI